MPVMTGCRVTASSKLSLLKGQKRVKSSLMDSQFRARDLALALQVPAGIQVYRAADWLVASS